MLFLGEARLDFAAGGWHRPHEHSGDGSHGDALDHSDATSKRRAFCRRK
jgi:hypothetical protein